MITDGKDTQKRGEDSHQAGYANPTVTADATSLTAKDGDGLRRVG
jgi:hypothetical protein